MSDTRPDFTPEHRLPVWLSSAEVKAAIVRAAEAGADKAACWDVLAEINKLIARAA